MCDTDFEIPTCRICGCTDADACEGGCHWVTHDLCSACVPRLIRVLDTARAYRYLVNAAPPKRVSFRELGRAAVDLDAAIADCAGAS